MIFSFLHEPVMMMTVNIIVNAGIKLYFFIIACLKIKLPLPDKLFILNAG